MDFFYDSQVRRYLVQFMRVFSDIKVRNGPDAAGIYTIQRVPIMYGDPSRMVAQLIKGASENTLMPSPMFSAWIEDIKMAPDRRQDPQFVAKSTVIEREFNPTLGEYTSSPGTRQDIEMYMPVPYDIFFRLDVWTTNVTTKLQLFEQIATVFNPSIQLQQNSNILDWTSIFKLILESTTWSNRGIPQGAGDERDVMSFKFKVEAWITPPAKIKKSTIVAQIVTNVFNSTDVNGVENTLDNTHDAFRCMGLNTLQIITTEGNYKVSVNKGQHGDEIILLDRYGVESPDVTWQELIKKYGQITPNITKLRLKLDPDIDIDSSDIIGFITPDATRPNVLLFNADSDTLPVTTIPAINDIIDPTEVWPGNGLPIPSAGQRYLLASGVSAGEEPALPPTVGTSPWGQTLVAYPNDIIEYNGISWNVIFDSRSSTGKDYVINNSNGSHYTFDNGGWTYTYYGMYSPGYWRIDNIVEAPNGTTISQYE